MDFSSYLADKPSKCSLLCNFHEIYCSALALNIFAPNDMNCVFNFNFYVNQVNCTNKIKSLIFESNNGRKNILITPSGLRIPQKPFFFCIECSRLSRTILLHSYSVGFFLNLIFSFKLLVGTCR